jgi:hypothetical protein
VRIIQVWKTQHHSTIDTLHLKTGGVVNKVPVKSRIWPTNVYMGLSQIVGSQKKVTAKWIHRHQGLQVTEHYDVRTSQGVSTLKSIYTYRLSPNGKSLTLTIRRPTRSKQQPLSYVFHRHKKNNVYYLHLTDKWKLSQGLSKNAFLISLQGVANMGAPRLYFIYPDDWAFHFTPRVMDFYKSHYDYQFKKLSGWHQALKKFSRHIKGYVVWDPSMRSSLNVAFTVAGLDTAVVVTPDMVSAMKRAGVPEVANFSKQFEGMSDAQVYRWAWRRYGNRCNPEFIVWMGGVDGARMKPGIADYGMYTHAFFADLSTDPKDSIEYSLADSILSGQDPYSMVIGWHSYSKDTEHTFVTLTSHHGLRVAGLNSLPNMSFSSQIPTMPGFTFKNQHNIVSGKKYIPQKKVYMTLVQSDGLGLGTWNKPGRGELPYAWEVTMNWQWMAPAMLEFFYSQATPNDYFFGGLSGPGYMYPKAVPSKYLPRLIKMADSLMHKLDLNVFETMDYSQGSTIKGNTNLPKKIVKDYYKYMPDALGFLNGYAPAQTFYVQDGRPFVSFDYYLDQNRSVKAAATDLKELATINSKRPYFLVLHVREFNDIGRVKKILGRLGPGFKVVPLDVFLKLAGNAPTFKDNFMNKSENNTK